MRVIGQNVFVITLTNFLSNRTIGFQFSTNEKTAIISASAKKILAIGKNEYIIYSGGVLTQHTPRHMYLWQIVYTDATDRDPPLK